MDSLHDEIPIWLFQFNEIAWQGSDIKQIQQNIISNVIAFRGGKTRDIYTWKETLSFPLCTFDESVILQMYLIPGFHNSTLQFHYQQEPYNDLWYGGGEYLFVFHFQCLEVDLSKRTLVNFQNSTEIPNMCKPQHQNSFV